MFDWVLNSPLKRLKLSRWSYDWQNHYDCYKALRFLFVLSYEAKTDINFLGSWWSGNEKYFWFLLIASRALLQRHAEYNRILWWNFLTCYSCSFIVSWSKEATAIPSHCLFIAHDIMILIIKEPLPNFAKRGMVENFHIRI